MLSTGPGFQTYTIAGITQPVLHQRHETGGTEAASREGLVTNDYNTYQPRVGFSEDLFGNGKTVLRGGFGTFFERMQGNDIYNAATNTPFVNDPSASFVNMTNPHTSTQPASRFDAVLRQRPDHSGHQLSGPCCCAIQSRRAA